MKNVTFAMCRQYIEQHRLQTLFTSQPGSCLAGMEDKLRDKVLVVETSASERTIVLPLPGRYRELSFRKDRFCKDSMTRNLQNYTNARFRVSCFELPLNDFCGWLEDCFLEEEVALSKKDAALLQQHQIDVPPSRKTTRRHLKNAYQDLLKKADEKPEKDRKSVAPIIEKYCPPKQKEDTVVLELEEVLKADAMVEIPQEHTAVFTKYGIAVPQKTSYKDLKESIHKTQIHPDVLKTISASDLEVLRKYGIRISASGEAYGKVKAPRTLAAKIRLACYTVVVIALLAGGIWYFFGEDLKPWIQSEKIRLEAHRHLNVVKQYTGELAQEVSESARLHQFIAREYPPEQDYVEPHPRLQPIIKSSETRLEQWRQVIVKSEKLLAEKKYGEAREFLSTQALYINSHPEEKQTIARVRSKLQITQRINQLLKDETEREDRVQRVVSTLRQYVLGAGDWLDLMEEKLAIIATRYVGDKERIPVDPKIHIELELTRQKISEYEAVCRVIEAAMRTDYVKAETIARPLADVKLDQLDKLRDLDESLAETLRALEKLANKGTNRNMANQKLNEVSERHSELKKLLEAADASCKQLEKFSVDLGLPKPPKEMADLLVRGEEENKQLRNLLTKATQSIDDSRFNDAYTALSQELTASKTSVPELRRLNETLAELCQRGQMLQMEKSERVLQVSKWLSGMRSAVAETKTVLTGLAEEIELFGKEFAGDKQLSASAAKHLESVRQLVATQTQAEGLISEVENRLQARQLAEAHQLSQKDKGMPETLRSISTKAKNVRSEVAALASQAKLNKERQEKQENCQRILAKIEKYALRLKDILDPLQQNAMRLNKNYPASEGYPTLSPEAQAILVKAQKSLEGYGQLAKQAKELLQKKDIERAFSLLQPYEARSLSEPTFVNDLNKLQTELSQKLLQAENVKKGKTKEGQAEQLINEIRKRRDGLNSAVTLLDKNLQVLQSKYGNVQDTQTTYARQYLGQGQEELRSLNDLIATAERLTKEHKYNAAIDLVKPFTESSHSLLPALNSFVANTEKSIKALEDPQQRAQAAAKAEAEKAKAARQQKLIRAPGNWYPELESVLDNYDQIKPQMEGAVKEGIRIVLTTIDSQVSKAREYPRDIAEVDDIIAQLQQKGQKITVDPNSLRARDVNAYLEKRSLDVDLREELGELRSSVSKLQNELRLGGWVDEETLRTFLRNIKSVDRKYREMYLNVKSPLETLAVQLPN